MRTVGLGTPVRGPEAAGAASWRGSAKDKDLTAPPGSPALDDRYIVSSPATGLWSGEENSIAEWDGDAWLFETPSAGWVVYVDDEGEIYVYSGSAWAQESFGPHAATHNGGGSDAIDASTSSVDGLMSAADKTKLDDLSAVDENPIATTDETVTTIATIPISDDTVVWIETEVIARRTNAAGRGKWKRGALVYRESAGSATLEGANWTPVTEESDAAWDVDIAVSGNNALIRVTGAAGQNINWKSRHTVDAVS